jgi:hypothetical protein
MTDFFADLEAQLVDAHGRRPSHRRPVVVALAVVIVAGVAAVLALSLTGSSDKRQSAAPGVGSSRVTILNATQVPGAAARVAERLERQGFSVARVDDLPAAGTGRSIVRYRPGARPTASAVAKRLHIRDTQQLAHPEPGPRPGAVVVTIGSDYVRGVPRPLPVASFPLSPTPDGPQAASGTGTISRAPKLMLSVRAVGLARGNHYVAWLSGGSGRARPLGFAPTPAAGVLRFTNALPDDAGRYQVLLITRETTDRPIVPGHGVLSGPLRLP